MNHEQSLGNKLALIWEVYARIGLAPIRCVHLLRRQGVIVTPGQAKQQLYQARRRNTLRLVFYKPGTFHKPGTFCKADPL